MTPAEADPFDDVLRALIANDFVLAAARIDRFLADMPEDATPVLRSRARRVAATAHRLAGEYDVAVGHARAALGEAVDSITRIEAELEFGDLARTLGDPDQAVAAYERAAEVAESPDVPEPVRWQVHLRRALGLVDRGDLGEAADRLEQFGAGLEDVPMALIERDLSPAQVALVRALANIADDEPERAEYALEVAAREARAQEDVPSYTAAMLARAQLLEQRGDHIGAYGTLATGWATLRVGVGDEVGRAAFEPALLDLHERWGDEVFERVRAEFEAQAGLSPGS